MTTITNLLRNSSEVFNEVQRIGWVKITSKTRPDMVLMTQDELDGVIKQAKEAAEYELRA